MLQDPARSGRCAAPVRRRLLIAAGAATAVSGAALLMPFLTRVVPQSEPVAPKALPPSRDPSAAPDTAPASTGAALLAQVERDGAHARRLTFLHTHTGERLSVVYAYGDRRVPDALAALDWLLRDFRNDAQHRIDPALFDHLHTLHRATGSRAAFEIISGYRSPQTNAMLHRKSDGVAARSLHLVGQAIDVRLADVPLADLRDAALSLRAGGVGFYPTSNFVHLDTGRVRRW